MIKNDQITKQECRISYWFVLAAMADKKGSPRSLRDHDLFSIIFFHSWQSSSQIGAGDIETATSPYLVPILFPAKLTSDNAKYNSEELGNMHWKCIIIL